MVKLLRSAFAMLAMCVAMTANAQTTKSYTEDLVVTINEESTEPQPTTVTVDLFESGNINFTLKNFFLGSGEDALPVGNIVINDLALTDEGYCKSFTFNGSTTITDGDMEGVDMWLGPMIGEIPMVMRGKMTDDKLYVTIDIDMTETLGQSILVTLGEDIPEPQPIETKSYTEDLVVTINEESTEPQPTTVTVDLFESGNINFTLKNFFLGSGEDALPVGNIVIKDLALTDEGYCKSFTFNGTTTITEGDMEGVDMWLGPMIGEIPMVMRGKMTDDKLYVTINIDMTETLGQNILVTLGQDIEEPELPIDTKNYTEDLVVTINEESTEPQPTTVTVDLFESGNINFTLKNFFLGSGEDALPVGNIVIKDLALTDEGYCKSFSFNGTTTITEGDMEGVDMWLGPMLGEIPMAMKGKMTDDKLYVTIDIDMTETLGQSILVTLGQDIEEPELPIETKSYTEDLVVTINEESTEPQPTTVTVDLFESGNINFTLKNFFLGSGEDALPVGNIVIKDLALTDEGYCKSFTFNGTTTITEGDMEGVDMWLGPMIGEIPMVMRGKMTDDKLYVTIDIDMTETLGQSILVTLGQDIEDPAVAINSITPAKATTNVAFDLSGRKVNNMEKGNVYILNGKKIMK